MKMQFIITLNDNIYLSYDKDNVLLNDCRLINRGENFLISAKYYGNDSPISHLGEVGFWDNYDSVLQSTKRIKLGVIIKNRSNEVLLHHTVSCIIPSDFSLQKGYFELNDEVVKKIYLRRFHRVTPNPLEISGVEIFYNKN